jgi:hypothetical protein
MSGLCAFDFRSQEMHEHQDMSTLAISDAKKPFFEKRTYFGFDRGVGETPRGKGAERQSTGLKEESFPRDKPYPSC